MSEEQSNNRRIWSAALKSGKFKQTKEKLGDLEQGMCCLGVGCYVLGVKFDPEHAFPPEEFCKKVGLVVIDDSEINGEFDGGSLVNLNDVEDMPFPEIAVIIDTNASLWEGSDYQESRLAAYEEEKRQWAALDENQDDGA